MQNQPAEDEIPLACDLAAIPADQRERHDALAQQIFASVVQQQSLVDGYMLQLPVSLWLSVAEWALLENLCCPFIRFGLTLQPDGAFWLSMSGREGVKGLLAAEFNL